VTEPLASSHDPGTKRSGRLGGVISGGHSLMVLSVSVLAALITVAVTVVAARVLSVEDNVKFLVFWSLLFGVSQVMNGVQNEATRAVGSLRTSGDAGQARVILMPLLLGGAGALIVAAVLGVIAVFGGHPLPGVAPVVVAVSLVIAVSYGCLLTILGARAGRLDWTTVAGLGAIEPAVRLVTVLAVGLTLGGLVPLQLAAALPALIWLPLATFWRPVRIGVGARGDVALRRLLGNGALAMVAAGAGAVLINGFPVLTRLALADRMTAVGLATLLLAIQLTRAPLMMPMAVFQGVAISAFVARRNSGPKALVKPMLAIVALGAVLAAVMVAFGPFVMRLLYGAQYVPPRLLMGWLTFAATSIALLTLTGTAAIAISAHRAYLAGWWVGASAAVAGLFLLPLPPEWRVVVAVLCGPLLGVVVHLLAIGRSADAGVESSDDDGAGVLA